MTDFVDEVQKGFCIVESCCVTIVSDNGAEHHVTLPFPIVNAWPLERGILFERAVESQTPTNNRYLVYALLSLTHCLSIGVSVGRWALSNAEHRGKYHQCWE